VGVKKRIDVRAKGDDAAACGQLATNQFAAKEKARAATSYGFVV